MITTIEGAGKLGDYLETLVIAGITPHIDGVPGIGKTSIIRSLFHLTETNHATVFLADCEPTDIQGFPYITNNYTAFANPQWAHLAINYQPTKESPYFIVFFDELAQARPDVQQTLLTPLQDKIMPSGSFLPDHVRFICASNPADYSPRNNTLIPALANRMTHIQFIPLIEEWATGFIKNWDMVDGNGQPLIDNKDIAIRKKIASFVTDNKQHAYAKKITADYSVPSLRMYEKLASGLRTWEDKQSKVDLLTFVSSFIGQESANLLVKRYLRGEYMTYEQFFDNYKSYHPGNYMNDHYIIETCLIDTDHSSKEIAQRIHYILDRTSKKLIEDTKNNIAQWARKHDLPVL